MLPNLLIIGAAKCGTSSLHHYLDQHPEVSMSRPKETNFFVREDWRERRTWYESRFEASAPVRGEASPAYSLFPYFRGVPGRAHSLVPEAKLIYLVRDPLSRLVAHYVEMYGLHFEHRPFEEAVGGFDDPSNLYLAGSRYATQVEQYLRFFPRERLLVLEQDELRDERERALRRVFEFLEVDRDFRSPVFERELNTRAEKVRLRVVGVLLARSGLIRLGRRVPLRLRAPVTRPLKRAVTREIEPPRLEGDLRARLYETLLPEVERLRALTGRRYEGWLR